MPASGHSSSPDESEGDAAGVGVASAADGGGGARFAHQLLQAAHKETLPSSSLSSYLGRHY